MQNVEIGVVWHCWGCYPRLSAMQPYDRMNVTSYLTLIEIMHLSCTIFELYAELFVKSH